MGSNKHRFYVGFREVICQEGVGTWGVGGPCWCVSRLARTYANFLRPTTLSPQNFGAGSGNTSTLSLKNRERLTLQDWREGKDHGTVFFTLKIKELGLHFCGSQFFLKKKSKEIKSTNNRKGLRLSVSRVGGGSVSELCLGGQGPSFSNVDLTPTLSQLPPLFREWRPV